MEVNDQIASKKYEAEHSAKLCSSTMSAFMKKKEFGSDGFRQNVVLFYLSYKSSEFSKNCPGF